MKANLPDHYNTRLCVIPALLGFNMVKQLRTPIAAKTATNARGAGSEYVARGKWSEFIARAESSPLQSRTHITGCTASSGSATSARTIAGNKR